MSKRHTQGLLELNPNAATSLRCGRRFVASCGGYSDSNDPHCWDENVANAKRVKACWNACEGIEEPEKVVPQIRMFLKHLARTDTHWGTQASTLLAQLEGAEK